jgi:hypothetical protein
MDIRPALFIAILLSATFDADDASAVAKCVDDKGHVTYQEGECPKDSKRARLESEDEGPKSLLEEVVCGAQWMRDEPDFENEIGMVSKKDQIIMNGKKLNMPELFQQPAHSNFNFRRCGKYNYKRPTGMHQMSINRWTSWQAICKLKDPAVFDALVPKVNPQTVPMVIKHEDLAECDSLAKEFPTPAALEKHLRTTHHPLPGELGQVDKSAPAADIQPAPVFEPSRAPMSMPPQGASRKKPGANGDAR